jgi:DNA-binding winged helix-turn-helix (wHTH) protein
VEATDGKTPGAQHETYTFGHHQLDVTARRLTSAAGAEVPLAPRSFDLLVALVRRADRAVPRDELIGAVWGETIVEEGNLAWTIKELRRALGTDADVLETVRGFGYRFRPSSTTALQPVEGSTPSGPSATHALSVRWRMVAVALLAVLAAGGWWWFAHRPRVSFDAAAHEELAIEAYQSGAEALALDHARRGLELAEPGSAEEQRLAARFAVWSGDWPSALRALDGLEPGETADLEVALWRPRALLQLGDPAAADQELAQLRTLPEPLGSDPRLDLAAAWMALRAGDPAAARAAAQLAVATADRRGAARERAGAQVLLTEALTSLGDFEAAAGACSVALEGARAGALVRHEIEALRVCARLALVRSELDRADELAAEGLRLARARGMRSEVAPPLLVRASVALIRGRLADATAGAFEALGAARDAGAVDEEAAALRLLSLAARLEADLDAAERWAREGLVRAEQVPHATRLALLNGELGRALLERGDFAGAQRSFEAAARAQTIPSDADRALAQISLGWCRLGAGQPQAARALAEGALQRLSGPLDAMQIESWSLIAEAAAEEGNADMARQAAETLARLPRRHPPLDAGWRMAFARALAAAGNRDGAVAELDALLDEPSLRGITLVRLEATLRRAELVGDREALRTALAGARERGIGRLAPRAPDPSD